MFITPKAVRIIGHLRGRPMRLGTILVLAGFLIGSLGGVVGIAATASVSAGALNVCGSSVRIVPGDSGRCSERISDTLARSATGAVDVTVVISTLSMSGGGLPTATPPVATEALLDGRLSGLQVLIIDTNSARTFTLGSVACYTDASKETPSSYPAAAYCTSVSRPELVASSVDRAKFSATFAIRWSLPINAGNPYQGGGATISIALMFTATESTAPPETPATVPPAPTLAGGILGTHASPTPSPSVHYGVLGASIPASGAQLPVVAPRVLIVIGLLVVFAGLWVWRRGRYFGNQ